SPQDRRLEHQTNSQMLAEPPSAGQCGGSLHVPSFGRMWPRVPYVNGSRWRREGVGVGIVEGSGWAQDRPRP
ncbi:hypothetical protein ALC57_08934, partial [Trachymyrmex cornetzi]